MENNNKLVDVLEEKGEIIISKDEKPKRKRPISLVFFIILIGALGTGGYLMVKEGVDAASVAENEKSGQLIAELANVSFEQVGGKVNSINVKDGQQVEENDVLMTLDTTDIDLKIAQLDLDLEQMNVQISQAQDAIQVSESKVSTKEKQALLGIESAQIAEAILNQGTRSEDLTGQQLAIQSAQQSVEVARQAEKVAQQAVETAQQSSDFAGANYERTQELYNEGLTSQAELEKSKSEFDKATSGLNNAKVQVETAKKQIGIAQNGVKQHQVALEKMQSGLTANERKQAQLATQQAQMAFAEVQQGRKDIQTSGFNVELLEKQKEKLEVQLETLEIQKERMILRAPMAGTIKSILPKINGNVGIGATVIMLETAQLYYEIYVAESKVPNYLEGQNITSYIVPLKKDIDGVIRHINLAPQYASLQAKGEKGLDDINSYLIRVDVSRTPELLPGMSVEVNLNEATH